MEFSFECEGDKIHSALDNWFEHLREDARRLGVDVEPITMCERIEFEQDARWMALA